MAAATSLNHRSRYGLFGVLFALVAASSLLGTEQVNALAWHRAPIADGQWWRLITGHMVHGNGWHAAMNAAGIAVIAIAFARTLSVAAWLLVVLASMFAIDVVFALRPWPETYVGFSGVAHALLATPLVTSLARDRPAVMTLLAMLWLKVIVESMLGGSESTAALIGLEVATSAHLTAVAVGSVIGSILRLTRCSALARDSGGRKMKEPAP